MKKVLLTIVLGFGFQISNAQQTYVPDDNFEQALINLGYDTVLDDSVLTANISGVSSLSVGSLNIADLTGIEAMVSLTNLECDDNNITSLDVSNNTLLNWFICMDNQLDSIDVSNNPLLTLFYCDNNNLTSIDVTNNIFLNNFDCYTNQLTSLDLSQNINLVELYCEENQLTALDLSSNVLIEDVACSENLITSLDLTNNQYLNELECENNNLNFLDVSNGNNQNIDPNYFRVTGNSNLTCINVDDVLYSSNNWTQIDPQHYFSTNCSAAVLLKTYVPDDNFEAYIEGKGWGDGVMNDSVSTTVINNIDSLNIDYLNIADLTGLEDFLSITFLSVDGNPIGSIDVSNNLYLTYFYCRDNNLSSVDISSNTQLFSVNFRSNQLTQLDVSNNYNLGYLVFDENQMATIDISNNYNLLYIGFQVNQLVSLDVSNNPWLQGIDCWDNQITSLDLSNNTWLMHLNCENNELNSLDIRNGVNSQMNDFKISYNSYLECIDVDDSSWATNNWTFSNGNIDPMHYFSNNCNSSTSITELEKSEKTLLSIVNIIGEEVAVLKENQIYFYIYADGTVVKQLNVK